MRTVFNSVSAPEQAHVPVCTGDDVINSMTGFGRCEAAEDDRKVVVEIKSVNHRYCDINIKMPRTLSCFETRMRALIKKYLERGKVDVFISYTDVSAGSSAIKYNRDLAESYMEVFARMEKDFGIRNDICVSHLSRYPDVLVPEEAQVDEEELWAFLEPVLEGACRALSAARNSEGMRLKEDLLEKLDDMAEHASYIESRSPDIMAAYRANLQERMNELLADTTVDESRIAMEAAVFADKICVDEEIVRLRSHIQATREILSAGNAVGRKLDFVAQEMNREANTILSKSPDTAISDHAIALKTDIEKVREQIQNLE